MEQFDQRIAALFPRGFTSQSYNELLFLRRRSYSATLFRPLDQVQPGDPAAALEEKVSTLLGPGWFVRVQDWHLYDGNLDLIGQKITLVAETTF